MYRILISMTFAFLLFGLFTLSPIQQYVAVAQSPLPPADIAIDEGGPTIVTGTVASNNFAFLPDLWPDPTVALMDVTNLLRGQPENFVPAEGQILGLLTESLFPGPGQFQVNLPIAPTGQTLDVDNDDQADAGVQIFALRVSANVVADSYLQQLEQAGGLATYLTDVATGLLTEGTLLIYAPDGDQGFPSGFGEDGQWFTADDPTVALPAGYTLAMLDVDGSVTFDRSAAATMDTRERVEEASPDFSDQGIVESYNSLIDVLAERYAYTELRGLDWEEIRQAYLPQVEEADANQDIPAYYITLVTLATSIEDAHVAASALSNVDAVLAKVQADQERIAGSVGASVIAVSDENAPEEPPGDKIVVLTVGEGSPAAEAGWTPGTEIVAVNGQTPAARYEEIPLPLGTGVEEVQRFYKTNYFLSFPLSQTVTIGYRLPDANEVMTATMMTSYYDSGYVGVDAGIQAPVTYAQIDDYAVVRWGDFMSYLLPKIAVLEEALAYEQSASSPGMILDLRSNSGGWVELYETMASYFFTEEEPMPIHVFDWSYYDTEVGDLVTSAAVDYQLSAPRPELAYTAPLIVLVDPLCASACEYFTQHLQVLDRATVVGQYSSVGAGGPIDRVAMPGDITFQYTMGRTTFAGTDDPNLEAKGVVPDIRVPVTLETELGKMDGEDPVMAAAVAELDRLNDPTIKLTNTTWQWVGQAGSAGEMEMIEKPSNYTVAFAQDETVAIQADCNQVNGTYALGDYEDELSITLGPSTAAACPADSRSDDILQYLPAVERFWFEGEQLILALNPDSGVVALGFEPVEGE